MEFKFSSTKKDKIVVGEFGYAVNFEKSLKNRL